jgi:hypothetical protein
MKDPIENRKVRLTKIMIIHMKKKSPHSYEKIVLEVEKVLQKCR